MTGRATSAFSSLSREAAEVAGRVRDGVVVIRNGQSGHGSGVIWDAGGTVITNDHVVKGDRSEIVLADGRVLQAKLVRKDHRSDLAALQRAWRGTPSRTSRRLP